MRSFIARLFVLFAASAFAAPGAEAQLLAPAHLVSSASGDSILLSGPIGNGTGNAFVAMVKTLPQLRIIRLNSLGGLVNEARIVSREIRSLNLDTYVGATCVSACTMIFYSGKSRFLQPDAKFGFHGYAALPGHPVTADQILASEDVDRRSYIASGLADWFVDRIFSTPSKTLWLPTTQELLVAKFATDITVADDPYGMPARDGLPSVNHVEDVAGAAPLPHVITP